jgi:cyclopropane fatty-acyl-phospholipid synthase-like methyltransferase
MENRNEFDVYNKVYTDDNNYAKPHKPKVNYVKNWVGLTKGKVLDVGCGRGEYLREVMSMGNNVFGVELSKICSEKYLQDVPHECNNIKDFANNSDHFEKIYSTDVLEHIPPSELDDTLKSLSKIGDEFLFLVASGSDKRFGIELHLSNHTFEEWEKILSKDFKITKSIKGFHEWPYIHIFELTKKNY